MEFLIDSNVLIDYTAERFSAKQIQILDEIFDAALNVSVITKIEALGFNTTLPEEDYLSNFFLLANIINLNDAIVERTIQLRKTIRIKIPDALIAATALIYNYTLLTRNKTDFLKVIGLNIINPHEW